MADNISMRLLILFALYLGTAVAAENAIATGGAASVQAPEVIGARNSLGLTDSQMEFVLDSSVAKKSFESCRVDIKLGNVDKSPAACLWERLGPGEKEKITQKMNELTGGSENQKNKFESQDDGFLKQANKDPAFQALQKHLEKKLKKIIYGDVKKGKLAMADHMVFHDLYKSQLSKNVISAMSSYCLDADTKKHYLIPEEDDLVGIRKENLKMLGEKEADGTPSAQLHFGQCVSNLKNICYRKNLPTKMDEERKKAYRALEPKSISTVRACSVITYIKQLKQNIIAIDQITERVDKLKDGDKTSGLATSGGQNIAVYSGEKNETITSMGSKEFIEESGFKDAAEAERKEFEKCYNSEGGQVVDESKCEKYLSKNLEESERIKTEDELRGLAAKEKLKSALGKDTKEGVTSYLTDQGFSEEEVSKMISGKKLKDIENKIIERYESERIARIEQLNKRIDAKTISADEESLSKSTGTKGKLQKIGEELASKTKRYTELVHFNNIVSGFLATEDAQGKQGQNTNALAVELAGSAYGASDGRGISSKGNAHLDSIKSIIKSEGIKADLDEDKTNTLDKGQINQILNYSDE